MTETEIQKEIVTFLNNIDCIVYPMNAGSYTNKIKTVRKGTPDLLILMPSGYMFWIEVKSETGELSDIQEAEHKKLRRYSQSILVARSVKDVQEYIK